MKSGWWIGGIVWLALLITAAGVRGDEEVLFVNDHPVSFADRTILRDGDLLVPLVEFGREVGVELWEMGADGAIALRWTGARRTISPGWLPRVGGVVYAPVRWLTELIGARLYTLGSTVYVRTNVPACREFEATGDRVVVRFAGFTPHSVVEDDGELLHLRIHHSRLSIPPRHVAFGSGVLSEARIVSTVPGTIDLYLWRRSPAAARIRCHEAAGSYAMAVEFGDDELIESVQQIDERMSLREIDRSIGERRVSFRLLSVRPWRDRWALSLSLPASGIGRNSPLAQIALAAGAHVAIGVEQFLPGRDLLVIDRVPLSLRDAPGSAIGVDLFGRWAQGETRASAILRVHGEAIAIDAICRPISYGELVAYPPGYNGPIVTGVPGALTAVKVREERVVSVSHGAAVFPDPSAVLVVASGDARAALADVSLGDRLALEVAYDPPSPSFQSAVSCGAVLWDDGAALRDGSTESHGAWSVMATDRLGGVHLGIIEASPGNGVRVEDVVGLLEALDVPIRDAVVVSCGAAASLAYWDGSGYQSIGGTHAVPLGICLVPSDR